MDLHFISSIWYHVYVAILFFHRSSRPRRWWPASVATTGTASAVSSARRSSIPSPAAKASLLWGCVTLMRYIPPNLQLANGDRTRVGALEEGLSSSLDQDTLLQSVSHSSRRNSSKCILVYSSNNFIDHWPSLTLFFCESRLPTFIRPSALLPDQTDSAICLWFQGRTTRFTASRATPSSSAPRPGRCPRKEWESEWNYTVQLLW